MVRDGVREGIGEFSKVTGLSVKTLRFYHENEILVPRSVDDGRHFWLVLP